MATEEEIKAAIELLNKNDYLVLKINKAQIAIAKSCTHDKKRCDFNLLGIKCVDLVCLHDEIREQIFPYTKAETEDNAEEQ